VEASVATHQFPDVVNSVIVSAFKKL
jgi:hypothetical protein